MTDQVLDILKLVLLGLLYLFFARVLWAVWSEVRQPAEARDAAPGTARGVADYVPPTPAGAGRPAVRRAPKPGKGRSGVPARLVVLEPKHRRGAAFAITERVTIGRDDHNTIRISDDEYVSGHHAAVAAADGHVIVDDLGSRNGTYLNGSRISVPRSLQTGDRIQIGYTVLEAQ